MHGYGPTFGTSPVQNFVEMFETEDADEMILEHMEDVQDEAQQISDWSDYQIYAGMGGLVAGLAYGLYAKGKSRRR